MGTRLLGEVKNENLSFDDLDDSSQKQICASVKHAGQAREQGRRGKGAKTEDGEAYCVKTTPQMTRFRDAKVCNNLATEEIDDHRIQSDYKCISGLQNPEGKNSTLDIASAW